MTNPVDFALLGHNLKCLQASSQTNQASSQANKVFIDYFGYTLYTEDYFFGRILKWIAAIDWWSDPSPDNQSEKFKKALLVTGELFHQAIVKIKQLNDDYRLEIQNPERQRSTIIINARNEISSIAIELDPIFSYFQDTSLSTRIQTIDTIYRTWLGQAVLQDDEKQELHNFATSYAMTIVEGLTQLPFPIASFLRLLNKEAFDSTEKSSMEDWISACLENKNFLTSGILHKAITGVVESITSQRTLSRDEFLNALFRIEWQLFKGGLYLLEAEDPVQKKWQEQVFEQRRLQLPSSDGIESSSWAELGEPWQEAVLDDLGIQVFKQNTADHKMVMLAKNPAQLGIWEASCEARGLGKGVWAVPPCKVLQRDLDGKVFVTEELVTSLAGVEWRTKFGSVAQEDKARLDEISRLVCWLACQTKTAHLSLDLLFFNKENRIRVLTPFFIEQSIPFDFLKLENFVRKVSKDQNSKVNFLIFRYIMHRSHLVEHPLAKFLYEISEIHLKGTPKFAIREIAAMKGISDPNVIDRAYELTEKLKKIRSKIIASLSPMLRSTNAEGKTEFRNEVTLALLSFQKELGLCSTILPKTNALVEKYLLNKRPTLFHNLDVQSTQMPNNFLLSLNSSNT